MVEPTNRHDLKLGVDLGVPRGAQWWFPGIPLQCKLSNVTQDNMKIQGGLVIATVYAVNNYDRERMKSLMNPVSEEPTSPKQDEVIKEKDKGRPPEQRDKGGEIADIPSEAPKVDLGEANFGQLSPSEKDTLMGILNEYIDVFAVNPKSVPACKGVPMRLELKDPNVKPYVAPIRHYSPEQREMIQTEVAKLLKNGSIRESTSDGPPIVRRFARKMGQCGLCRIFEVPMRFSNHRVVDSGTCSTLWMRWKGRSISPASI